MKSTKLITLSAFICLFAASLFAQTEGVFFLSADSLQKHKRLFITQNCKYHPGDSAIWAESEFDDSTWETLAGTRFELKRLPPGRLKGVGWLRLHLGVDSTLLETTLALHVYLRAVAAEIYLDGKLLCRFGKVGTSLEEEQAYIVMSAENHPPTPILFDKRISHVIAVRFSNFREMRMDTGQLGFAIALSELSRSIAQSISATRYATNFQMLMTATPLVFALLHLLLFAFYPRLKANLYFAFFAMCIAAYAFLVHQILFSFVTDAEQVLSISTGQTIVLFLMFPLGLRFLYSLFYTKAPKLFWILPLIMIGSSILLSYKPLEMVSLIIGYGLTLVTLFEMLRVVIVALVKKKDGAWIIGIGFLAFIMTAIMYFLGGPFLLLSRQTLLQIFWLVGVLGLLLSMSIYLARYFARTSKNLEAELVKSFELEVENARKTKELEEARQLQLSMLPKNPPVLPHLDIAAEMKPATEVGGDYYDFKVHDNGVLTIAVGDATGHGMQAGTMVAATKSLFNALADEPEPASILQKATKALKEMGYRKMYMALTIAKIQNHQMLVAAAGMPYTLIHRAAGGDVEEIALKAMPLGSFPNFKYEQKKIALEPGDTVLFLSDGLEEMFDPQGEILGAGRVKELVAEAGQKPSEQVIAHLKNAGKAWANGRAQEDDVTMVVVKVAQSARLDH